MYRIYLNNCLLPVAPSEIITKINNKNEIVNLINEGEVNLVRKPGLTEINFEVMLPNTKHPFAIYKKEFKDAEYFLRKLEKLKLSKKPFQLIINRIIKDKIEFFRTNLTVTLEEYTIIENAEQGTDVMVEIKLKQYRDYGLKTYKLKKKRKKGKGYNKVFRVGQKIIVNGKLRKRIKGKPDIPMKNITCRILAIKKIRVNKKIVKFYSVTPLFFPIPVHFGWATAKDLNQIRRKKKNNKK